MKGKKPRIGRPEATDKKRSVTFMAKGSKIDMAIKKAGSKPQLNSVMENLLYDYLDR